MPRSSAVPGTRAGCRGVDGADPSSVVEQGLLALDAAVVPGSTGLAMSLVGAGVDPNSVSAERESALARASWHGYVGLVRLLLATGSDPNIHAAGGDTALHWAAQHVRTDGAGLLGFLGARSKQQRAYVQRLYARVSPWLMEHRHRALRDDRRAVVQALLDYGADLNSRNLAGKTPLAVAAEYGAVDLVQVLLDRGADPDILSRPDRTTQDNMSALQRAAARGDVEMARVLLAGGADPNLKNNHGDSAMHFAADYGETEMLQLLLDYGGDPNSKNTAGYTVLLCAEDKRGKRGGHMLYLLSARSADDAASKAGQEKIVAAQRAITEDNSTALMFRVLLDGGADPDARAGDGAQVRPRGTLAALRLRANPDARAGAAATPVTTPVTTPGLMGRLLGRLTGARTVEVEPPPVVRAVDVGAGMAGRAPNGATALIRAVAKGDVRGGRAVVAARRQCLYQGQ